ncbi:MAG: GNAT family N-acetyltransferase [Patescibacteria group bacterium]
MSEIIIREYIPEDREAVEKCSFELQQDEWIREPHYWGRPEEIVSPYIDYVLKEVSKSDGRIFVAEKDGIVVGFIVTMISQKEDSPAISLEKFGYVMDLAVLREYQGKGFGKALMLKAEDYVREKGLEWMHLDVTKGNPAHDFYLKSGYRGKSIRLEKNLFSHSQEH